MPLANDGHVPVELLIGPTKNDFNSFSNFKLPDRTIEVAPIAWISPEKINLDPFLFAKDWRRR